MDNKLTDKYAGTGFLPDGRNDDRVYTTDAPVIDLPKPKAPKAKVARHRKVAKKRK